MVEYKYPIQTEEFEIKKEESFLGQIRGNIQYSVSITPPDIFNNCFYFNVWVNNKYINVTNDDEIFKLKTYSCFRISFDTEPTLNLLFKLLNDACLDAARVFHFKTRKTLLLHHNVPRPKIDAVKGIIEESINLWTQPKDQSKRFITKFKYLPEIPLTKQFLENNYTEEQLISFKLLKDIPVKKSELEAFKKLTKFYDQLSSNLTDFKYEFIGEEFTDFKNYINSAFNYLPILTNEIEIYKLYRLTINQEVGENKSIVNSSKLSYRPKEIKTSKYNRANTPETTVFYATENINTALKERRPKKGTLVTIGIWKPRKSNIFRCYPIVYDDEILLENSLLSTEHQNIKKLLDKLPEEFKRFNYHFFKLLTKEYTKRVNHDIEYTISSIFSEKIFSVDDPIHKADCILYPSVGHDLKTVNLAIKSEIIDANRFELIEVMEFRIKDENYDNTLVKPHDVSIKVVDVEEFRSTKNILPDGSIIW